MVCIRGDIDVDANIPVIERNDWLLRYASLRKGRKGRNWHRHLLAEARLGRLPFRRSQMRIRQRVGVRISLQQSIVQPRQRRNGNVRRREVRNIVKRKGKVDSWKEELTEESLQYYTKYFQ